MPIRINLLAETQAVEELRRHDPVKRMIFCGGVSGGIDAGLEQFAPARIHAGQKGSLGPANTRFRAHTNEFTRVTSDQKQMAAIKEKLDALKKMTNSRFLQGNLLNALQQTQRGRRATDADKSGTRLISDMPGVATAD